MRAGPSIDLLRQKRRAAMERYGEARRRHSGQQSAHNRLLTLTTNLLRAEVAASRPRRAKQKPPGAAPDLFSSGA